MVQDLVPHFFRSPRGQAAAESSLLGSMNAATSKFSELLAELKAITESFRNASISQRVAMKAPSQVPNNL